MKLFASQDLSQPTHAAVVVKISI